MIQRIYCNLIQIDRPTLFINCEFNLFNYKITCIMSFMNPLIFMFSVNLYNDNMNTKMEFWLWIMKEM